MIFSATLAVRDPARRRYKNSCDSLAMITLIVKAFSNVYFFLPLVRQNQRHMHPTLFINFVLYYVDKEILNVERSSQSFRHNLSIELGTLSLINVS